MKNFLDDFLGFIITGAAIVAYVCLLTLINDLYLA